MWIFSRGVSRDCRDHKKTAVVCHGFSGEDCASNKEEKRGKRKLKSALFSVVCL